MTQSSTSPWKARLRAAGIHLSMTGLIAAISAALVFGLWYPAPYRQVSGGAELFLLVVGVDLVLGPALTFSIFDRSKGWPMLRRDLAVIVLFQLAALGYGMHTMWVARPVVLALEGPRFHVVPANAVIEREFPQAPVALRSLSATGPRLIATNLPPESERLDAVAAAMAGVDLGMRPRYWREWDAQARKEALAAGVPLAGLLKAHPESVTAVRDALVGIGKSEDQVLAVPMIARRNDWSVLIDKATGEPIGFAPVLAF